MHLSDIKKLTCFLAVAASCVAQGNRFDNRVTTSATNVPFGAQAPVMAVPNATVTICAYPAIFGPSAACTNTVSIYTDAALTQPATNPLQADGQGNFGFWIASGTYTYSVQTVAGSVLFTRPFTVGGSGSGNIVSVNGQVGVVTLTAANVGAAGTGACNSPQVVQATTSNGVTCVTPPSGGSGTVSPSTSSSPQVYGTTTNGSTTAAPLTPAQIQAAATDTTVPSSLLYQTGTSSTTCSANTVVNSVKDCYNNTYGFIQRQVGTGAAYEPVDTVVAGANVSVSVSGHTATISSTGGGTNNPGGSLGQVQTNAGSAFGGVTATTANTPSTIVSRDSSTGGFSAGPIDSAAQPTIVEGNGTNIQSSRRVKALFSTVFSGNYPSPVGDLADCDATAPGYNNGSTGSTSAYGWWIPNCRQTNLNAYGAGIAVNESNYQNAFKLGDSEIWAGYLHGYCNNERGDDENCVNKATITQLSVTTGTITSGASTGSALLQSTITSGDAPPNGDPIAYVTGGWLLDMSKQLYQVTITGYGFDSALNSNYYTYTTTGAALPASTAWGNFTASTCPAAVGQTFVSQTCTVVLGPGSASFANSSGAANHIFASGPFREEMAATFTAASGGSQSATFTSNASWNGSNNSIVGQGTLSGASLVDSTLTSGSIVMPSYTIVHVTSSRIYFASPNSTGQSNGINNHPGNVLAVGTVANIYPSAKVLSTSGVAGQAALDVNSVAWANGDSIESATGANPGMTTWRLEVDNNTPNQGCPDVALNCALTQGLDVRESGLAPIDQFIQLANSRTGTSAVKAGIHVQANVNDVLAIDSLPRETALKINCNVNGVPSPGSAAPLWLIVGNNGSGPVYGHQKVYCNNLDMDYDGPMSMNGLLDYGNLQVNGTSSLQAVTGTTFNGVPLTSTGSATTYLNAAGTYTTPSGGGSSGVSSFNTRTGAVTPASGDYTVSQVTGAAPLASPSLTGTPTAPTASSGTNTTQLATTAFVGSAISGLSGTYAPLTNPTGGQNNYAPLASPTFTGTMNSSSTAVASILAGGATTSASDALAVFRGASNSLHTLELQAYGTRTGNPNNRTAFIMSTNSASPMYEFGTDININASKDYYIYSYQSGGWIPFYVSGSTGCVGIGAASCTAMLDVTGNIRSSSTVTGTQFIPSGSAPTIATGAAAGTSPGTPTVTGTNIAGVITVTTGTSTTTGTLATITYNGTLASAPYGCRMYPRNAATPPTATSTYTTAPSTTTWTIAVSSALTASTTYSWSYQCE